MHALDMLPAMPTYRVYARARRLHMPIHTAIPERAPRLPAVAVVAVASVATTPPATGCSHPARAYVSVPACVSVRAGCAACACGACMRAGVRVVRAG